MVVVVVVPFMGGCSWPFVVGVGGWWWCSGRHVGGAGHSSSLVGGAAGHSMLVIHVVIGRRSPLVFGHRCSLLSVTVHCSSVSSSSGVVSFRMVMWPLTCWRAFPLGRGNEVGS